MRAAVGHRPVLFVLAGLAITAAAFAACKKDGGSSEAPPADSTRPVGTMPTATATATATAPTDAAIVKPAVDASVPLAIAKGDPCRGAPLPLDQHFVPAGMCARLVASSGQLLGMRQITFAPNGDLFAVTYDGAVELLRDSDGDGVFDASEIHDWGTTVDHGNNVHIAGNFVYAGSGDGVKRWPYVAGALTAGASEDVMVGQPTDGHPLHTVHVYDGYLYVSSGCAGNQEAVNGAAYETNRALLRRFKLSSFVSGTPFQWLSGEVISVGLRNMVGFTQNAAGRMYGVVNGIDGVSYQGTDVQQDNPGEQVLELAAGKTYGWPFCFTAQNVAKPSGGIFTPGTQLANDQLTVHDDAWCALNSAKPATFLQAHSAPLEIVFFDRQPKGVLPERWRGGAFVAMHGSSYRATLTGYKVVWIPFDASGNAPMPTANASGGVDFPYEIVFGGGTSAGPVDGKWTWMMDSGAPDTPRPIGLAFNAVDGALYIGSDGGHVYRVGLLNSGK